LTQTNEVLSKYQLWLKTSIKTLWNLYKKSETNTN